MDALLTARLTAGSGTVTTQDVMACGHDMRSLQRLVRDGELVRVCHGGYADGSRYRDASPEQRHALTARAVVATFGGRVLASHHSALALLGLPLYGADLGLVHVTRVKDLQSRRRAGVVVHQAYGWPLVTAPGSLSVPVPLALLGNAMVSGPESGVVAIDSALAGRLVTPLELTEALSHLEFWPGVTAARLAVELADGRSESVGESRTRLLLRSLGLAVIPQAKISDLDGRVIARVDFLLSDAPVVIEFDGAVKYDGVDGRGALVAEKAREDAIRSLGYEVVRLVWADLSRPERVARAVALAVQRAGHRAASGPSLMKDAPRAG